MFNLFQLYRIWFTLHINVLGETLLYDKSVTSTYAMYQFQFNIPI